MSCTELARTAGMLVAAGKDLLAVDESTPACDHPALRDDCTAAMEREGASP